MYIKAIDIYTNNKKLLVVLFFADRGREGGFYYLFFNSFVDMAQYEIKNKEILTDTVKHKVCAFLMFSVVSSNQFLLDDILVNIFEKLKSSVAKANIRGSVIALPTWMNTFSNLYILEKVSAQKDFFFFKWFIKK